PRRSWATKASVWFTAAIALMVVCLVGGLLSWLTRGTGLFPGLELVRSEFLVVNSVERGLSHRMHLTPWLIYGFSSAPFIAVLAVLWEGGCLWYRVAQVPDVGAPFDIKAFEAGLPDPENNEAGRLIGQAVEAMKRFDSQVQAEVGPPAEKIPVPEGALRPLEM